MGRVRAEILNSKRWRSAQIKARAMVRHSDRQHGTGSRHRSHSPEHDEWCVRVLSELREDSRTKAVWDGDFDDNLASLADCAGVEFKDSASYSSWSSIEFKDPHAQKLFGAKAGGATLSPSPSKESLKDQREGSSRPNSKGVSPLLRSKTLPSKETQKPTTHRMSLTFMITHEEHRKNVPSIASRVIGESPMATLILALNYK